MGYLVDHFDEPRAYRALRLGLALFCAAVASRVAAFEVATTDAAARGLSTCLSVDDLPGDKSDRLPVLDRGAELAQSAIAADPSDPRARVALVCNLGKALEIAGLSWRSLQRLRRLRDAVDEGLRIGPDDPDLLTSKGEMLLRIPAALGGDPVEGERCLRRAIELRPDHPQAHRFLAEILAERNPTPAGPIAER